MEAAYLVMVIFRALQAVRPIFLKSLSLFEKAQTLINSWIGQEIYMIYLFIYLFATRLSSQLITLPNAPLFISDTDMLWNSITKLS